MSSLLPRLALVPADTAVDAEGRCLAGGIEIAAEALKAPAILNLRVGEERSYGLVAVENGAGSPRVRLVSETEMRRLRVRLTSAARESIEALLARSAARQVARRSGRTVEVLGVKAEVAETFAARARGLIGREPPARGEGLLIPRCNCIHTFFMSYAIDAVFLDSEGRVVKTVRNIRPWRILVWGGFRARSVLETAAV